MTLEARRLQGSRHWFGMILAQQFPSISGNRSLLTDLCALSVHDCPNIRVRGIYKVVSLILSVLIETEMSSFSNFSSNSYRKKCKYYRTKDYL